MSETPSDGRPPRNGPSSLIMLPLAAAILLGGGTWAWISRDKGSIASLPAPSTAQSSPTKSEIPPEGKMLRALNLPDIDGLEEALVAVGVDPESARSAARAAAGAATASGSVRANVELLRDGEELQLSRVEATFQNGESVIIERSEDGTLTAKAQAAHLTREIQVRNGEIDGESFYSSAVSAGVINVLIPEFINAFAYDFNLASEVSPGDTFEVGYELSVNAQGDAVGQPRLLFASLTTKEKSLDLYRFVDANGKVGWYDGNGASTKRGFMRTPIDGARITSNFGMRFHPVLKYNRLHGGTDFAAPVGTPIYAASDGTVLSATPSRCAGNMVILRHEKGYQTRYFHLSRYADNLASGRNVTQGETIGYVGNTGTCTTGPHLHYEVHINGKKIDPLSIKVADSERARLKPDDLARFMAQRDRVDAARAEQAY